MTLTHELDDAVEAMAALFRADTDADTNLCGWADESWRVRAVLTDDLIVPAEYPVIYVSATTQQRQLVAADAAYDVRFDLEVLVEQEYREPTETTSSKRELIRLCRRVEEVLWRNRIYAPYWERSIFHALDEPLRIDLYQLRTAQHVIVGGLLAWWGARRVTAT